MGGLVLTTTTALGASVLAAGPAQAAVPQRATLAAAPAAPAAQAATAKATAKQSRAAKQRKRAAYAVKYAAKQIGDPYRYGGTGPGSWDCSGLAAAPGARPG